MRSAAEHLRRRDLAGARSVVEQAIAGAPDTPPLLAFAGLLACEAGDPARAVDHLEQAVRLRPDDRASHANLVIALAQLEEYDRAIDAAAGTDPANPRVQRVLGFAYQRRGDHAAAAAAYEVALAAQPQDAEAWNNLGNAFAALGRVDRALTAFERSIALAPGDRAPRINGARVLADAGRHEAQARWLQQAIDALPDDAQLWHELGLAEATLRRIDPAEAAFRQAIDRDPRRIESYLELGLLLENLNRLDALDTLVERAEHAGVERPEFGFLKAWQARRRGHFDEAMALAEAVPDTVDPIRRHQLVGELADRLGQSERAVAALAAMNEATARVAGPGVLAEGKRYLAEVTRAPALIRRIADAGTGPVLRGPASPIFITSFPRSGTTLLDTMLMNVAGLHVLEEEPVMRGVELALGDMDRLPELGADEVQGLRDSYFDELRRIADVDPGARIVDKSPLHTARIGLIHRLFPDAPIIFAERHPADVVLSCFFSNFQPNRATVNFLTLDGVARLYDAVMQLWWTACERLPLQVHHVRYERMVEDPEAELRPLLDALNLPWDAAVLDHQASAARRGQIRTASYAQVTEPLYRRSAGRWQRYARQLAPVLPILEPWVERMGYTLDP